MRVVVVGAYGLVGSYVVAALLADGHSVAAVGRDVVAARRREPAADWAVADLGTTSRQCWASVLAGASAVVNCAGALQDGARDDLAAVHVSGLQRLVDGCWDAGVARFVQISALGIDRADTAFATTKRAGDAMLRASGLDIVILRPGLVLAPSAYGGSALLRALAAMPLAVPFVEGGRIQVIAVEDVARAVVVAVASQSVSGKTLDLCHADPLTLEAILLALRGWLGLPPAPAVRCPTALVAIATSAADGLGHLGWRSAMRSTALDQLRHGIAGDGSAAVRNLGFSVLSLREMLSRHPAGVQERWFARVFFLKPLALVTLGLFWGLSGLLGLARLATIAAMLRAMNLPPSLAAALAAGGSLADLALGLGVAHRRTARAALVGMLAVSAFYVVGLSIVQPALWLDPFGALAKTVPAALLALFALAVMDER